MPGEDGFTFIRKVRELDTKSKTVPALALTAYAGEKDRQKILSSGFQMYLAKPVDSERLKRTLLELSGLHQTIH